MDTQSGFKQFFKAVFHELFRSATAYNILAALVLSAVICAGYFWPERYVSSAALAVELGSERNDISQQDLVAEMTPSELANYQIAEEKSVERLIAFTQSESVRNSIYQKAISTWPLLKDEFVSEQAFFQQLKIRTAPRSNIVDFQFQSHSSPAATGVLEIALEEIVQQAKPVKKLATITTQVEDMAQTESSLRQSIDDLEQEIDGLTSSLGAAGLSQGRERIRSIRVSMEDAQVGINAINARIDSIRIQLEKEEVLYTARQRLVFLENQQAKLLAEIEKAKDDYGPNAPQIISLQQELDNVRIELGELKNNPLVFADNSEQPLYEQLRKKLSLEEVEKQSIESRYESLRKLLSEETNRVAADKNQQQEISERQEALTGLKSRLAQIQQQKETRLQRQSRIKNNLPSYRIANAPSTAERYQGFGFVEFLILGPLLACIFPFIVAAFIVLFDSRIRSVGQIRSAAGGSIPLIAVIPHYSSPKTARVFRRAMLGIVVWGLLIFSAYATLGVIGLRI